MREVQEIYIKSNLRKSDYYLCDLGQYGIEVVGYVETKKAIVLTLEQYKEDLRKAFESGESRTVSFEGFVDLYHTTTKEKV